MAPQRDRRFQGGKYRLLLIVIRPARPTPAGV